MMKDELTAKMHSEFDLPPSVERKLKAWTLLDVASKYEDLDDSRLQLLCDNYNISPNEIDKYYLTWIIASARYSKRETNNRIRKVLNHLIEK